MTAPHEPYTMDPVVKALWVEGLRSERYRQGYGYLECDDCHCALGVLCDLAATAGIAMREPGVEVGGGIFVTRFRAPGDDCSTVELPEAVMTWAGLRSTDPYVLWSDKSDGSLEWVRLSTLNDERVPLNRIGAAIEMSL